MLSLVTLAVRGIHGSAASPGAPVDTTFNQLLAGIPALIPLPFQHDEGGRERTPHLPICPPLKPEVWTMASTGIAELLLQPGNGFGVV